MTRISRVQERLLVRVTDSPLDPCEALRFTADPAAGASVLFSGTVRDHSAAGAVESLTYEAWAERALSKMEGIGREALRDWGLARVALLHRTGMLAVGETSVVVCCSAPHRQEAFEAARHGIERIKREIPVWKKESLSAGESHWVMGP